MTRFILPIVAAALLAGACRHAPPATPEDVPPESAIVIEVENQSSVDLAVYLIVDNLSQRLGTVSTNGVLTAERSWQRIGAGRRIRLRAEVIGSATRVVTDNLLVSAGQLIRWTLTPDLKMSFWGIY